MAESQIITQWGASFLKGTWRYIRQTFSGCGQDSFSQAPSQNEDMGSSLLNVLPPLDGGFRPRWGYTLFNGINVPQTLSVQSQPIFLYQNDLQDYRKYVVSTAGRLPVLNEDGSVYATNLFNSKAQCRMVTSRSYGYFASGVQADLQKWNGGFAQNPHGPGTVPAMSNWGIAAPSSPSATEPNTGLADGGGINEVWTVTGVTSAAVSLTPGPTSPGPIDVSNPLQATGFGFTVPASSTINGVVVSFTVNTTGPTGLTYISAQLIENGVPLGQPEFFGTSLVNGSQVVALGASTDTWSSSLAYTDTNAATFGVQITVTQQAGANATVTISAIQMIVYAAETVTLTPGSGNITLVSGRIYYVVYENSTTGHYSDLSLPSPSTGPLTSADVVISNIPISPDAQVSTVVILATSDGGNEEQLYYVGQIPNGTTTFTDNTPDTQLVLNNVYLEADAEGVETGVSNNDPPPADLHYPIKHRGRLYGVSGIKNLFFSKADSELLTSTGLLVGKFEECWPALNYLDISEGAEEILGLLSDGQVLYIGTERRIIRLFGDGPATYLQPEALFIDVGILNQDVWQLVFLEGNPVGAMWLTHDLRVVGSDFNTYQDVGMPIQDVLNTINIATAQQAAWAAYLTSGQYCLYVLGVPTGSATTPNTLLVFDMKLRQWYVWRLADSVTGATSQVAFSNNQVLNIFTTTAGPVYRFDPTQLVDRNGQANPGPYPPASWPITIQTSFTPMGDPAARKYLNEIEVMTGDLGCKVTVEGASTRQDFLSPHQVIANAPLVPKPLGQYFVSLASRTTLDRYYRFTFNSTSTSFDELRGYNVEGTVLNRV